MNFWETAVSGVRSAECGDAVYSVVRARVRWEFIYRLFIIQPKISHGLLSTPMLFSGRGGAVQVWGAVADGDVPSFPTNS